MCVFIQLVGCSSLDLIYPNVVVFGHRTRICQKERNLYPRELKPLRWNIARCCQRPSWPLICTKVTGFSSPSWSKKLMKRKEEKEKYLQHF